MTTDAFTVACDEVSPAYRKLFHPGDWDLVTQVIGRDPEFKTEFAQELQTHSAQELADRVLAAAIQFIRYAGSTGGPTPPSVRIDIGWHALVLTTRVYRYVCDELLGYFLDHEPINSDGQVLGNRATPADTAAGMKELGLAVDELIFTEARDGRPGGSVGLGSKAAWCMPEPSDAGIASAAKCINHCQARPGKCRRLPTTQTRRGPSRGEVKPGHRVDAPPEGWPLRASAV